MAPVGAAELAHREKAWQDLRDSDGTEEASPARVRELGIFGGASGVWVDTARTRLLAPPHGVAVAVLHTGRHYPDDLSDGALLYHYPNTDRQPGRDRAEIEATKECRRQRIPLFVITESGPSGTRRRVRQAWVEEWDDDLAQFLISFEPTVALAPEVPILEDDAPFLPFEDDTRKLQTVKARPSQQRFRFDVLRRYGARCAMCDVAAQELLKAAHLIPANKRAATTRATACRCAGTITTRLIGDLSLLSRQRRGSTSRAATPAASSGSRGQI